MRVNNLGPAASIWGEHMHTVIKLGACALLLVWFAAAATCAWPRRERTPLARSTRAPKLRGGSGKLRGGCRQPRGGEARQHLLGQTQGAHERSVDEAAKNGSGLFFPKLRYHPELDGLRAVAVVPVVLYHFEVPYFTGGFAGVDVFFVISGFLITSILLSNLERDRFSVIDFWGRRVRRLQPALLAMLVSVGVVGWFLLFGDLYSTFLSQGRATLLLAANYNLAAEEGGYWGAAPYEKPLLHCWSLAVEEQYYLLYPFVLWGLWGALGRVASPVGRARGLFLSILAIFAVSLTWSIAWTKKDPTNSFYLLPTRAWEMALGGLVAFPHARFSNPCLCTTFACVGLGTMVASYFLLNRDMTYPGHHALLPCVGAAIFIVSQRDRCVGPGSLLSLKVPVFIGRASYSLYLWHWPVYVFAVDTSTSGASLGAKKTFAWIAFSCALATLSFLVVEPTFRNARKISNRAFFPSIMLLWAGALAFAWIAHDGGLGGIQGSQTDISSFSLKTSCGSGQECLTYLSQAQADDAYSVPADRIWDRNVLVSPTEVPRWDDYFGKTLGEALLQVETVGSNPAPTIAFVGSSHCLTYMSTLKKLSEELGATVGSLCIPGAVASFLPSCLEHGPSMNKHELAAVDERLNLLREWKPDLVVWATTWLFDGRCKHGTFSFHNARRNVKMLLGTSKRVLILGDTPRPTCPGGDAGSTIGHAFQLRSREGGYRFATEMDCDAFVRKVRAHASKNLAKVAKEFPERASYVDLDHLFTNSKTGKLEIVHPRRGTLVYRDCKGHLNEDGVERIEQVLRRHVFKQPLCGWRHSESECDTAGKKSSCRFCAPGETSRPPQQQQQQQQ